jgi:hypothetical protein
MANRRQWWALPPTVFMWGRLRPGLAPRAAEEELSSLAAELRRQYPDDIWEKESLPSEPGATQRA